MYLPCYYPNAIARAIILSLVATPVKFDPSPQYPEAVTLPLKVIPTPDTLLKSIFRFQDIFLFLLFFTASVEYDFSCQNQKQDENSK